MAAPSRLSVRSSSSSRVLMLQADCAPASCSGVEDGVFNWVDGGNGVANGIAYGRWAEQGDNEVVAVFPAP